MGHVDRLHGYAVYDAEVVSCVSTRMSTGLGASGAGTCSRVESCDVLGADAVEHFLPEKTSHEEQ